MGRLLRIAIYAFLILIAYIWVTAMVAAYNKNKQMNDLPEVAQYSTAVVQDSTDVTAMEEEVPAEMITNRDIINGNIDYDEVDKKVKIIEEVKKNTPPPPTAKKPSPPKVTPQPMSTIKDNNDAGFGIIAGTFSDKSNADNVLKLLKAKGFKSAKVNKLKDKSLFQVVAGIYQTRSLAEQKSNELISAKIDNFVKQVK